MPNDDDDDDDDDDEEPQFENILICKPYNIINTIIKCAHRPKSNSELQIRNIRPNSVHEWPVYLDMPRNSYTVHVYIMECKM